MKPNTSISVDCRSDDVEACAAFYGQEFGSMVEGRPTAVGGENPVIPEGHTSE
jgi:hypothetical protein